MPAADVQADTAEFWDAYLAEHPDVLHRLLADIYRATYGDQRPPTLDDLWDLMAVQQFAAVPFGQAVRDALGRRSVRWLSLQCGMAQPVLTRYLNGTRPILSIQDPQGSMRRLEQVARGLRVHPSYFSEWRRLWIMTLIDSAFSTKPDLSIGIFRRFSGLPNRSGIAKSRPIGGLQ